MQSFSTWTTKALIRLRKCADVHADSIMKTRLFRYIEILPPKNEYFQIKNSDIFHISAQNIDCGYSLEPP